jgi:glucose/arabinose dehydrogenase
MQELPAPYEGPIVRNAPLTVPRAGWQLQLPDGFAATLYADNLENPRQILILPNGDVLVALQKSGSLMMLRDDNRDGRADRVEHYASGCNQSYGLAHREGELLIAMTGFWVEGDERALVWGRPADVALAPDGALFVVDDTGGTLWRVTYTRYGSAGAATTEVFHGLSRTR